MSNCIYRTDNHYQSLMLTVAKHLRTWTLISVKSYWTYNLESLRPSPTLLTVPKNHHFITRIPIYIYIRTYISLLLAVTGRGAGQRNRTKPCRRRIFIFCDYVTSLQVEVALAHFSTCSLCLLLVNGALHLQDGAPIFWLLTTLLDLVEDNISWQSYTILK